MLAILGILIALAVPRYLSARKKAYLEEADNLLQEVKTLEWAYYQQWNMFDTSAAGASIGFAVPGGMHWNSPVFSGTNAGSGNAVLTITMSGSVSPLNSGSDSVSILLYSDGSSGGGSTF